MKKWCYRDFVHGTSYQTRFFEWMYKPSAVVDNAVDRLRNKVPKGAVLVGMHIRSNHFKPESYYIMYHRCLQHLPSYLGLDDKTARLMVFVASDSYEVKKHMKDLLGDRMLEHDVKIEHTGMLENAGSSIVGAAKDLFTLAACDVLFLTKKSTWTGRLRTLKWRSPLAPIPTKFNGVDPLILLGGPDATPAFCGAVDLAGARNITHLARR